MTPISQLNQKASNTMFNYHLTRDLMSCPDCESEGTVEMIGSTGVTHYYRCHDCQAVLKYIMPDQLQQADFSDLIDAVKEGFEEMS